MDSIHIGHQLRFLVPSKFETRILGKHIYTKKDLGWSPTVKKQGIFFDLSRVEWVDLGSLVQLVLLIETALREGIKVKLALPFPKARQSEEEWMKLNPNFSARVRHRIDNRKAAKQFLDYLNFEEALRAKHLKKWLTNLQIIPDYDPSIFNDNDGEFEEDFYFSDEHNAEEISQNQIKSKLYKYCFPLTWLSSKQPEYFVEISNFLAGVIGESKRGLEILDADTITNVLLYELVENVTQHAECTSWALVSAWARPEHLSPNPQHYLQSERPYLEWLAQKETSLVEIIVGDSGKGIPAALKDDFNHFHRVVNNGRNENAEILLYAFDRWSSSKNRSSLRGTRGLYRVDRIVKKYQGLISIRSENQLAGWDHGGPSYDQQIINPKRLSQVPGTLLRLRIPPYHEYSPLRISPEKMVSDLSFKIIELGSIDNNGLSARIMGELQELLQEAQTDKPVCVIGVISGEIIERAAVDKIIRQAVDIRHPAALAIYGLTGGWDLIENIIDSINSEHENDEKDSEARHFQIWDPVLVLDAIGHTAWVGASASHRNVLNLLISNGGILTKSEFDDLLPDSKERASILRSLRNDTNLVLIGGDGSIQLRFTIADISNELCLYVSEKLIAHVAKSGFGVLSNEVFRAPSLHLVKKWLDVGIILEKTCGARMAMLALSIRLRMHECWQNLTSNNFIFSDSTSHSENVALLQKNLGLKRREVIPGETGVPVIPGVRVVKQGSSVIIHCDIIASNETVKRCFRQILRDDAVPIAITCVFDARLKRDEVIEMWDIKIPIISLTEVDIMVDDQLPTKNINPITRQIEEYLLPDDAILPIAKDELCALIKESNALHFSHIGRPIGRHFTFYLDVGRLHGNSRIIEAFNSVIDEWIGQGTQNQGLEYNKIEIWHPDPESRPSAPARKFAEKLNRMRQDIDRIRPIRREPAYGQWYFSGTYEYPVKNRNVVVIDWGALTGHTITQMIRLAANAGAKRILVCVFLSQLPSDEEGFLTSLEKLRIYSELVDKKIESSPLLPGFDNEQLNGRAPKIEERKIDVSVSFLSRFPISAYTPNDCPVCQQLIRLSQESYPSTLLKDYADKQNNERLKIRTREEIHASNPKDFDLRELEGSPAIEMVYFRDDLVTALGSTEVRHRIHNKIENLLLEIQENKPSVSDEALSLVHFLSIESQWLRRPPLYFKALKNIISEIAFHIATNQNVPIGDRLNAIIVLRTSSKIQFANHFSEVFKSATKSEQLLEQLLYDAFTYIVRPYHQALTVFEPILRELQNIQRDINEGNIQVSESLLETITRLEVRAESEFAKAGARKLSPPQAWAKLKRYFGIKYRVHDPIPQSILDMLPGPDAAVIENILKRGELKSNKQLPPNLLPWLKSLEKNWTRCCSFLDFEIIPLLTQIKPILQSEDAQRVLGTQLMEPLLELIEKSSESKIPVAESPFSKIVSRVSRIPDEVLNWKYWEILKSGINWYWDLLKVGGSSIPTSKLIDFIMSAPCSLGDVVQEVYEEITSKKILPQSHIVYGLEELRTVNYTTFCTRDLLRDLFKELFLNVKIHLEPNPQQLEIWVDAISNNGFIEVSFRNNSTNTNENQGKGLKRLQHRIKCFDATLEAEPRPKDENATFEVLLKFKRGD